MLTLGSFLVASRSLPVMVPATARVMPAAHDAVTKPASPPVSPRDHGTCFSLQVIHLDELRQGWMS